ncbi:MAG: S8 family serine peptidase [Acidimicrobiales bacterium]
MKLRNSHSRRIGTAALALIVSCGAFLLDGSTGGAAVRTGPARTMIVMLRNQNSSLAPRSAARSAAVKAEQAPIVKSLRASGATHISSVGLLNAIVAKMSAAEAAQLAANPAVESVLKNATIPGPAITKTPAVSNVKSAHAETSKTPSSQVCGTPRNPQLNPEALTNINALPSQLGSSDDGTGVTVATIADGLDPNDPDFVRNAAYGTPGQPVVTQYDFSGDASGVPTAGEEAFGDASSIASQGNTLYDLSTYVAAAHALPTGCDIKIVGDAPGASVDAMKVFSESNDTTESNFIEAINFAVASGAKVINESFGSNQFPDTALDITRDADDAAVAAGVTVVVSSGDAGITSTIGSPATDPNVISVGATTTFRAFTQFTFGGINDPAASGGFVDNNISSFSSGGFSQSGNTVDLVAPGDSNWALCSADSTLFTDCTTDPGNGNGNGDGTPFDLFGGTSESAPLTAGAAADVISAYASSHNGQDPTPALVKQILMSTATDIGAPATEQGAGLLNVLAAVKEAKSIHIGFGGGNNFNNSGGGLLLNPGQINVVQNPGQTSNQSVQVTNTGNSPVTVNLATRALSTTPYATQTGTFCLQPDTTDTPPPTCPANTGTFPIWSGVNEVYQNENFVVPSSGNNLTRLEFAADYLDSNQTSLLHVALLEPNGSYAAYSEPQGLADFAELEVTNPMPGKWTAVFFTENNADNATAAGTNGPIQWSANEFTYGQGGNIFPSTLFVGPGQTAFAHLSLSSSNVSGDTDQSVVVTSPYGTTTVPVTVRTTVQTNRNGGTFNGVLTGGNGRAGAPATTSSYEFNVPWGQNDLDVDLALANDPGDAFLAYLVDPNGQTVGYSTNVTSTDGTDEAPQLGLTANLYKVNPMPGEWSIVMDWLNPVSGMELSEPFSGTIQFNQVEVTSNLPNGGFSRISSRGTQTYNVNVTNTGNAPEAFFVDPRLNQNETITLPSQNGSDSGTGMSLPLGGGFSFPYYLVPSQTSQLQASLTSSVPVTFDMEYFPGDPDISPGINSRWQTTGGIHGNSANVTLTEPEVSPGLWLLNPTEEGPYPASGEPSETANANVNIVTQTFDPWMTSSTGDMWTAFNGLSATFAPVYLAPGASATITVTVAPTGPPGTHVSGTLFVDDYTLGTAFINGLVESDELAAIPYSYTVSH